MMELKQEVSEYLRYSSCQIHAQQVLPKYNIMEVEEGGRPPIVTCRSNCSSYLALLVKLNGSHQILYKVVVWMDGRPDGWKAIFCRAHKDVLQRPGYRKM
jgi:hypothetical protein